MKRYNLYIRDSDTIYKLSYILEQHRPARIWAQLMLQSNISDLRKDKEVWCGIPEDTTPYVNELYSLVEKMNEWIPNKINFNNWNHNDVQASVNLFHTHFPECRNDTDPLHRQQLERYNDLIHHIESIDRAGKITHNNLHLTLLIGSNLIPLDIGDYNYFTFEKSVGSLIMGYPIIGRNPAEIMYSNDVNIPTDQIIPQNVLGAMHFCFFHDSDHAQLKRDFNRFYYESGIKWPYALGDLRLSVGAIRLGQLDTINGQQLSDDQVVGIVKSCNQIVGWSIE